ncbi:MAG TPA: ABC transporter permease [Terracidiphilus sp.]|jgi:predicted permease|nr:ABC transporter permease [Terracidiphilus sp.]
MRINQPIIRGFARMRSWLRAVFHRGRLEAEMEAELANHLEERTGDLMRAGYSLEDAARRARMELGPVLMHKEEMRASLGLRWVDETTGDLRYAARMLRKSPEFTAIAATSLALAIGANTTIFSVAKQLLYERLAVANAENLRLLAWTATEDHMAVHSIWGDYDPLLGGLRTSTAFSYPAFRQLQTENRVLDVLFAFKWTEMNATIRENPQRVVTEMVSGNYYTALGVKPQLGRVIEPTDDAVPGQGAVAVIGDGVWEREFGRSVAVLGQTIKLNDTALTIIGVAPKGFTGAQDVQQSPDLFVPLSMQPLLAPHRAWGSLLSDTRTWWVNVMGRAKSGVSDDEAQATLDGQLGALVRGTMPVKPGEDLPRVKLRDGSRGLFVSQQLFAKPMTVLMTLVGFVLLLACANIANMKLARGTRRQREMSVRLALGASRARILRQILVESLLLAALGGAGGLLAGYFGRTALPKLVEDAWERNAIQVRFDWKVFAFTAGITISTGILFGMAPALAAARAEVSHGLKEGAQTTTRRRKGMGSKALIGFQIALSTLLVIGAGLFVRTFARLNAVHVRFRTDHLLLAEIVPPERRYPAGKDIALHQRLEQAIAAVPGVDAVAPSLEVYVADETSRTNFLPEGERYSPYKGQAEYFNVVGDRFFQTLEIPIIAGRAFGEQDTATSQKVGIINESLARSRFPGQNPIGKRFAIDTHDADGRRGTLARNGIQIVGICGDVRYATLRAEPPPQFIVPYVQQTQVQGMTYEIRTRMKAEAIVPALRRAVQQVDPDLPLMNIRTQDQQIGSALQQERLFVTLTSGFGLLALALAAVGIYGVMAYSVARRTNEIGIRLALGAQPAQVCGMILREGTGLAAVGVAAGLAGAIGLTRLIKSMLYGIAPYDPVTLASGVGLLLFVALASSWIPARRAAGVQPMTALRHE